MTVADTTERRRRRWTWERECPYDETFGNLGSQPIMLAKVREGFDQTTKKVTDAVRQGRFNEALLLVGNEEREGLLHNWYTADILTPEDMNAAVLQAWDHGPKQMRLDYAVWVEMFRFGGFVSSPPQLPPSGPVAVWRGQPFGEPVGMSWTTERAQAEWFAERWTERDVDAVVLHTIASPAAILGIDNDREENEVIVDPAMLEDVTYEGDL